MELSTVGSHLGKVKPKQLPPGDKTTEKALFHITVRGTTEVIPKAMPSLQRGSTFLLGKSTHVYIGDRCVEVGHSERVQCKVIHD